MEKEHCCHLGRLLQPGDRQADASACWKVAEKYGHTFHYTDAAMGGEAIDKYGDPLPSTSWISACADSVLLGAVGGPKWEGLPAEQRPEKGLLRLRAGHGSVRQQPPGQDLARSWRLPAPLKPEIVAQGIDFIIVRELIGGVYFGKHETHTLENGEKQAIDTMPYSEHEIERIGRIGFETARKRRKKLSCVDKANVLDTSRLWREVMHRLQAEYPDVEVQRDVRGQLRHADRQEPRRSSTSSSPRTCSATSFPTRLP